MIEQALCAFTASLHGLSHRMRAGIMCAFAPTHWPEAIHIKFTYLNPTHCTFVTVSMGMHVMGTVGNMLLMHPTSHYSQGLSPQAVDVIGVHLEPDHSICMLQPACDYRY